MFDDEFFDSALFDTGIEVPITVILSPPIWRATITDGDGWTRQDHGRGLLWSNEADSVGFSDEFESAGFGSGTAWEVA